MWEGNTAKVYATYSLVKPCAYSRQKEKYTTWHWGKEFAEDTSALISVQNFFLI